MPFCKKIILVTILISSAFARLQAHNPYSFIQNNYTEKTSRYITTAAQPIKARPMIFNTYHAAKPLKSFAALMACDFKLKIRLNNINIIFSYN